MSQAGSTATMDFWTQDSGSGASPRTRGQPRCIGASLVQFRPGKLLPQGRPGVALATSGPSRCSSVPGNYYIRQAQMHLSRG
jgi:hypothetical protein